jgi:hypothetical protein
VLEAREALGDVARCGTGAVQQLLAELEIVGRLGTLYDLLRQQLPKPSEG